MDRSNRLIVIIGLVAAGLFVFNKYGPKSGKKSMINAAAQGQVSTLNYLLAQGEDPNAVYTFEGPEAPRHKGASDDWKYEITPLGIAAWTGKLDAVKALLAGGADPNLSPRGLSPLRYAISNNHPDIVDYLLQHGADPYAKDQFGQTPADFAEEMGHSKTVNILKKAR